MEIRLAHPNEMEAIVNILEDARAFLATSGINQWQESILIKRIF